MDDLLIPEVDGLSLHEHFTRKFAAYANPAAFIYQSLDTEAFLRMYLTLEAYFLISP